MRKHSWGVVYGIIDYTTPFAQRVDVPEDKYGVYLKKIEGMKGETGKGRTWRYEEIDGINGHFSIVGLTKKVITGVAQEAGLPLPNRENFHRI